MPDLRRILILTADVGYGHRSAANAIVQALNETHAEECTIDVVNPLDDPRVPRVLRKGQRDSDRWIRQVPRMVEFGYAASDAAVPSSMAESAITLVLLEVMRDVVRQHHPDAIVTTYPLFQAPLRAVYALEKRHIPLLTVVTDFGSVHRMWFHETADLCLVPTAAARDLAIACGLDPDKVVATGIPVRPDLVRAGLDQEALRNELGWQPDLVTFLAVGSQRVQHLPASLRGLNHAGYPLQLVVVAGGNDEAYAQFRANEWHVPTHVYNYVQEMPKFMRAADAIICKAGGLIVTEALACGLPIVLIGVLPGQEMGNAAYVLGGGAGEMAHNAVEVLEIVSHWLSNGRELLRERAASARLLARPNAAYDVAELTWHAALGGPRARPRRRIPSFSQVRAWFPRRGDDSAAARLRARRGAPANSEGED